jgi:hypothetical protein
LADDFALCVKGLYHDMKDILEAVQLFTNQSNPWALALATIGISFYLWKMIRELSNQGHGVREKKLSLLLTYVDGDISKKHRFSVEQAFSHYYSRTLTYNEIAYLLATKDPSASVQDYVWASSYITFDTTLEKPILRRPYRLEVRKKVLSSLMFSFYLLTNLAFVAAVFLLITKSAPSTVGLAVLTSVPFGVFFWFSLTDYRSVMAAERLTLQNA